MKVAIKLFKREKIELPEAVIELFRDAGAEELDVDDSLLDKIASNEDLATSWAASIASSYKDRADLVVISARHNNRELSIASYTKEKPANYYMIAPKIAKLYRVLYIPASLTNANEGPNLDREMVLKVGENGAVVAYTPPEEYYAYESIVVPKDSGVLVFEHEYGSTAIDLGEIRSLLASSRSSSARTRSTRSKKRRKKRKKSRRKKRVASAK